MTKLKYFLTLTLALVFVCTSAIAVSASPASADMQVPETTSSDTAAQSDIPQVIDITPDSPYEESQAETDTEVEESVSVGDVETAMEESQEEQQPTRKQNNNTPYFIGAVIAVIMFIGVVLYCKFKGGSMQ